MGGIILSMVLGLWRTSSSKQPTLLKEGDYVGLPTRPIFVAAILDDVAKAFPVPLSTLLDAFGVTEGAMRLGSLGGNL